MTEKIRIGIICGGRSAEHEVSLVSARSILEHINRDKYEVVLIGIDRSGSWSTLTEQQLLDGLAMKASLTAGPSSEQLVLRPGLKGSELINLARQQPLQSLDVIFPVLHGTYGEDGTVQGLLKLVNIPFVGASVLGSAIGMDKDVAKRLLVQAGMPVARFLTIHQGEQTSYTYDQIIAELGSPFFVKPANLGSSVGINRVTDQNHFKNALEQAFSFDRKIIIEEAINGREIECSVLGNENPIASLPGEIVPHHEFYSYAAKYLDENGAQLIIPADLPANIIKQVQIMAVKAFAILCCEGMARVDFFLKNDETLLINEINTIPGFTSISMYPKLWEVSGIPFAELLDRLISLALQRFQAEARLNTSIRT